MNKRQWIAIACAPVWIFALRFAWLEAAPMSRDVDDWLFTTRFEQPPACPTHYDIASARSQGLGDAEIADWFASGCPKGGPASPGESASESPTAVDWDALGTPVKPAAAAPAWLKQSDVPSWAPKPQKTKAGPWTEYKHKPDGQHLRLVPVEGDSTKRSSDKPGSVAETLRAAEASRSKRTADQPPAPAASPQAVDAQFRAKFQNYGN